jgi:hypothetical protein
MMKRWGDEQSPGLREEIIALSLREDIPTAFTSLQVDDPELSLVAIKPGDPVLSVSPEAGLTEVVAWYPFGETRRLVQDPISGTFSDRFLVPRGWDERAYRIEIFKHFSDGGVRKEVAWYVLDEQAPDVHLVQDLTTGAIRLQTGPDAPSIGRVELHQGDTVVRLSTDDDGATWALPGLSGRVQAAFTVVIRDRAGNRSTIRASLDDGTLAVVADPREPGPAPELPVSDLQMSISGTQLAVHGEYLFVGTDRDSPFLMMGVELDSLRVTAGTTHNWDELVGTQAGDLLKLSPGACNWGTVTDLDPDGLLADHPITGFVSLNDSRLLVGVNGMGLFELDPTTGALERSRLKVGSRFITGLTRAPDGEILVATAYNGLWRVVDARGGGRVAVHTRFAPQHVSGFSGDPAGLVVHSGEGRFVRLSRDRFVREGAGLNDLDGGSPDLMDAVIYGGETYVAGFDQGLLRLDRATGELQAIPLDLSPADKRINVLAVFDGRLFLGTEGGLLSVDRGFARDRIQRHIEAPVHDLSSDRRGLAVASSRGLFVVAGGALETTRIDDADASLQGRFMSVAWHDGALWAGGMDGLARIDGWGPARRLTVDHGFDAGWVTSLLSDPETGALLVGTYADGVWRVQAGRATQIEDLANQWVPPHGLTRTTKGLFVGGLGMNAVLVGDTAARLPLPVRDANDVLAMDDGRLMVLTSDGLAWVGMEGLAGLPTER